MGRRGLAVCESIHDVIALEAALKSRNLKCMMVPTPRAVSTDCGMSLEFTLDDFEQVIEAARQQSLRVEHFYSATDGEFSEIRTD